MWESNKKNPQSPALSCSEPASAAGWLWRGSAAGEPAAVGGGRTRALEGRHRLCSWCQVAPTAHWGGGTGGVGRADAGDRGKAVSVWLPGSNESSHACHDCLGLGKPPAGLPGLGQAAPGSGGLSPCHSSMLFPVGGGQSEMLGGCCGISAVFASPPSPSRRCSIAQRSGGGSGACFPCLLPALPPVLGSLV